jgi:hypothetical protein
MSRPKTLIQESTWYFTVDRKPSSLALSHRLVTSRIVESQAYCLKECPCDYIVGRPLKDLRNLK